MGIVFGVGLLLLVTVVAVMLGVKATQGVAAFREEHHRSFLKRRDG